MKPYLHKLFNVIISTGTYPGLWGEGFIVPIFKKGDIENVENYRGITLLSVVGKLFTSILNNRLNDWAENYNVYIEAQAGFRKGMGTTDNIFILHGLIHALIIMKNYLQLLSTFKKHLTILCMTYCGLNLWRLVSVEKC